MQLMTLSQAIMVQFAGKEHGLLVQHLIGDSDGRTYLNNMRVDVLAVCSPSIVWYRLPKPLQLTLNRNRITSVQQWSGDLPPSAL